MELRIETLPSKKLVGMWLRMTLLEDKTMVLGKQFMPRRTEVKERVNANIISMKLFDALMDQSFSPETAFTKWIAVEVAQHTDIPEGMEAYTLTGGLYAVFIHQGPASTFPATLQYIFETWLPQSDYELDHREHFEVLGPSYNPKDPTAEEEVWIPIK